MLKFVDTYEFISDVIFDNIQLAARWMQIILL